MDESSYQGHERDAAHWNERLEVWLLRLNQLLFGTADPAAVLELLAEERELVPFLAPAGAIAEFRRLDVLDVVEPSDERLHAAHVAIAVREAQARAEQVALDLLTGPRPALALPLPVGRRGAGADVLLRAVGADGDLLRRRGLAVLAGDAKVGKSSFAVGLCANAVAGGGQPVPYCGFDVAASSVLYVSYEMSADDVGRQACAYCELAPDDADRFVVLEMRDRLFRRQYGEFAAAPAMGRLWLEVARRKPDIVVVDPFMAASAGVVLNELAHPALNALRRLAEQSGAACIVVHHSNKAARASGGGGPDMRSGGTSFEDVPDTVMQLERSGDAWSVAVTHARRARDVDDRWLSSVPGKDSLVFEPGERPPEPEPRRSTRSVHQDYENAWPLFFEEHANPDGVASFRDVGHALQVRVGAKRGPRNSWLSAKLLGSGVTRSGSRWHGISVT